MIVTAVCLPSGLKTLVIPIFLPIMPFIFFKKFVPSGMRQSIDILHWLVASIYIFNPSFAADLFFASLFVRLVRIRRNRSTGSKQTLNGLFICNIPVPRDKFTKSIIQRYFILYGVYRWIERTIASLSPRNPSKPSGLDLNIHTGRQVQFGQRIHRPRRRSINVQQALVRMQLELLTGLLVYVRRTQYSEDLLTRG